MTFLTLDELFRSVLVSESLIFFSFSALLWMSVLGFDLPFDIWVVVRLRRIGLKGDDTVELLRRKEEVRAMT